MLPSPTTPTVLEDDLLDDFIQAWVVLLTGLPGQKVRPRWQPEPGNIPNHGEDWCGVGIVKQEADPFAAVTQKDAVTTELRQHEFMECNASFYGPNSGKYSTIFRDGAQLSVNRESLAAGGIEFIGIAALQVVPELVKERWLRRIDVIFILKRQVVREYGVPSILTANGILHNEHYDTSISVQP